jgi:hypothetical protein
VAEWTLFQTHCYSENLVALEIKPATKVSAARNSDHKTIQAAEARRMKHIISILTIFRFPLNCNFYMLDSAFWQSQWL